MRLIHTTSWLVVILVQGCVGGDSFLKDNNTQAPQTAKSVKIVNACTQTIWVGTQGNTGFDSPLGGGFALAPQQSASMGLPSPWGGRFWGRTGCVFDATGHGHCETADCGGLLQCSGLQGTRPASLAEFYFGGYAGQDFYDISYVDGFNLPLEIQPVPGTFTPSTDPNNIYGCGSPTCTDNLNTHCPVVLQILNDQNQVVACESACTKYGGGTYCDTPTTYSQVFKDSCFHAYSYSSDDPTSVFACPAKSYLVTFCP